MSHFEWLDPCFLIDLAVMTGGSVLFCQHPHISHVWLLSPWQWPWLAELKFLVCLMLRGLHLHSHTWRVAAVLDSADLEHFKMYVIISEETFKIEICDLLIILILFVLTLLKFLLDLHFLSKHWSEKTNQDMEPSHCWQLR